MKRRGESIKATAYHEAGHIVARWAQDGTLPREVIITLAGGIVKGPGFSGQEALIRHAQSEVVNYIAGPVAEKLATRRDRSQNRKPWGDYTQATEIMRLAGLRMSINTVKRDATRMLKRNWGLVELVAEALLERGRLRQEELLKIFQREPRK